MGVGSSQLWGKEQNSLRLPWKGLQPPSQKAWTPPPTRPGLSQKARLVPDGRGEGVRCWWTPLQPPWPKGALGQIPDHLQRASVSTSIK